jgi:DNA polymerase (family 10)
MNSELARAFERIADLLEITGGDKFRINSYRRVGRVVKDLTDDIRVLHDAGVLREVPGIGKGTAAKIEEFLDTGTIGMLEELSARRYLRACRNCLRFPEWGRRRSRWFTRSWASRISTNSKPRSRTASSRNCPDSARRARRRSPKASPSLKNPKDVRRGASRVRSPRPSPSSCAVSSQVERVEIAGSYRRGCETVGDLDLLCVSSERRGDREDVHRAQARGTRARERADEGLGDGGTAQRRGIASGSARRAG